MAGRGVEGDEGCEFGLRHDGEADLVLDGGLGDLEAASDRGIAERLIAELAENVLSHVTLILKRSRLTVLFTTH